MGVLSGRDLFSPKWPTAIIIDAVNTAHFVQVKHPIGDYFFVEINNELYAFDTKGDNFKWRQSLAKTFEFQIFFTDHYRPLTNHIKELELMMTKNNLPKISIAMYKVLSLLKLKEKRKFENFKILELVKELEKDKDKNPERYSQYKDVITYLQDLGIEEIITPVRRVSEYLDESFMATDPKYLGSVKTAVQLAFTENREINHRPITSKQGWLKFIVIFMGIGLIMAIGYIGYSEGWFDGLASFASPIGDINFSFNPPPSIDPNSAAAKYPSPEAAKAAIDAGQAKLTDFPASMRPLISSVKTPVAEP